MSLSTAYAIGDVLSIRHSLHRKVQDAKGFYAVYCGLIVIAAGLVLTPNAPLGLITNAVQTLAGVLLPSAAVFLLLLCNDKEVVGPWANTRGLNLFTGAVIAVLVMLSVILTVSVLFPDKTNETVILAMLAGGSVLGLIAAIASGALKRPTLDRETKSLEPRDVADAAAFATSPGSDVPREQNLDDCSARLSCSGGGSRSRPNFHAGHEQLKPSAVPAWGTAECRTRCRNSMAVAAHRLRLEYRIQRATPN